MVLFWLDCASILSRIFATTQLSAWLCLLDSPSVTHKNGYSSDRLNYESGLNQGILLGFHLSIWLHPDRRDNVAWDDLWKRK